MLYLTNWDTKRSNAHDIVGAEVRGTRENVGIADLTAFAKFEVTGANAADLLNRVSANKIPGKDGGMMGGTGMRYFTLTVTNLDEVLADCEAAGAKIIWPRREVRPGVNVGMVEDPDGNWVEFLETS